MRDRQRENSSVLARRPDASAQIGRPGASSPGVDSFSGAYLVLMALQSITINSIIVLTASYC